MFTIYGILVDVMRLGAGPDEEAKQDVQLWIDHQREIEFSLRVLSGLNLAVWREPNEDGVQDISPSNALKRLHRNSRCHYTYRHSRDRHLRAALALVSAGKSDTVPKLDMSRHNELNACTSNLVSIFGPGSGPTAEATARWVSEHTRIRAVTSLGRDSTEISGRKNGVLDSKVAELMTSLYNDARCGRAAAEYNLEKAGMIEMIFGHVAGRMRDCDNFWDDTRWTLTERGRRVSMAELTRIILGEPPLEIALWDATDEADDVAGNCGDCDSDDSILLRHHRILAHLKERAERILAAEKRREGR